MENLQSNEVKKEQSQEKWELKEYIESEQVKIILREWLSALEENRDLELTIKGESCRVPKEALLRCKTKAEFEFKRGEYELELELKWRESDLSDKQ